MRFRHLLSAAALALSCTVFAGGASADVDAAKTFVEREHGQIKKLVDTNAAPDQVRKAIDNMVDYEQLARRTLGNPCPPTVPSCTNHWDQLKPEQQTEVTDLLRQLVEKNFHKNLSKTRDYDITYRRALDQGANVSKIKTEAKSRAEDKKREPAVQVDYVILGMGGDKYRVIDIVTEGSSMTKNYYDQFHRMLTNPSQGYPYMVQKLQKKIADKNKDKDK